MDTEPTPLDYRSPRAASKRVFSSAAFVYSAFVVVVLLVDVLLIIPRFEAIFRDFNTTLPLLTMLLLRVSRFFGGGRWPVLLVIPVVIGFLAAALTPARTANEPPRRRSR